MFHEKRGEFSSPPKKSISACFSSKQLSWFHLQTCIVQIPSLSLRTFKRHVPKGQDLIKFLILTASSRTFSSHASGSLGSGGAEGLYESRPDGRPPPPRPPARWCSGASSFASHHFCAISSGISTVRREILFPDLYENMGIMSPPWRGLGEPWRSTDHSFCCHPLGARGPIRDWESQVCLHRRSDRPMAPAPRLGLMEWGFVTEILETNHQRVLASGWNLILCSVRTCSLLPARHSNLVLGLMGAADNSAGPRPRAPLGEPSWAWAGLEGVPSWTRSDRRQTAPAKDPSLTKLTWGPWLQALPRGSEGRGLTARLLSHVQQSTGPQPRHAPSSRQERLGARPQNAGAVGTLCQLPGCPVRPGEAVPRRCSDAQSK